jgi:hypothetical protein
MPFRSEKRRQAGGDSMRARWWAVLLGLDVLLSLLVVGIPLYLIRPFVAQTEQGVAVSYVLRAWGPLLTIALLVAGLVCVVQLWKDGRIVRRLGLVVATLFLSGMVAAARWSPEESFFGPLPEPGFIEAGRAAHVEPAEMVLGITVGGRSKAYPVPILAYHHLVNDHLGGVPLVATY